MEYQKNYMRGNMRSSQMRVTAEMSPYSQSKSSAEAFCFCAGARQETKGCRNDCLRGQSLAMVYSPCQDFKDLYDPTEALCHGTLFSELYKPFCGGRK